MCTKIKLSGDPDKKNTVISFPSKQVMIAAGLSNQLISTKTKKEPNIKVCCHIANVTVQLTEEEREKHTKAKEESRD